MDIIYLDFMKAFLILYELKSSYIGILYKFMVNYLQSRTSTGQFDKYFINLTSLPVIRST